MAKDEKEKPQELFEKAHNKFKVLRLAAAEVLNDENELNEDETVALNDFFWEVDHLFEDYATQLEMEKERDEDLLKGKEGVLECVKRGAFLRKEDAVKHLKEHGGPLDGIIERSGQLKERAEKTKASYLDCIKRLEAGLR